MPQAEASIHILFWDPKWPSWVSGCPVKEVKKLGNFRDRNRRRMSITREMYSISRIARFKLEILAVTNLDHETIRVIKEELVDSCVFLVTDRPLDVLHIHFLEPLFQSFHVFTLERDVIIHWVQMFSV